MHIESGGAPIEELIKSGELDGREALEYLLGTGLYVFHGSPVQISELQPHQATNHGQPDGEPAVAAATDINSPIFRALINGRRDSDEVRKTITEGGKYPYSGWAGGSEGTVYATVRHYYDLAAQDGVEGYVHTMDKSSFQLFRGEMRCFDPVIPQFVTAVTIRDLPSHVEIFETAREVQSFLDEIRRR